MKESRSVLQKKTQDGFFDGGDEIGCIIRIAEADRKTADS